MAKQRKPIWLLKAPPLLKDKFDRIAIARIKMGKDRKTASYSRLALALARSESMERELISADFIDDKRGQFSTFNIFTFMIIAFVAVLFFGGLIWANGLLYNSLLSTGAMNDANNPSGVCSSYTTRADCTSNVNCGWSLDSTCVKRGYVNMSQAAAATFGVHQNALGGLRLVAMALIFSMLISILITNALVKVHPLWFFPYILITILAILFAVPVSNAYESILDSGIYDGLLNSADWNAVNWLILNLPVIVMVTGFLGAIFMFANMVRAGNEQTNLS
jgi:hypothetical protein